MASQQASPPTPPSLPPPQPELPPPPSTITPTPNLGPSILGPPRTTPLPTPSTNLRIYPSKAGAALSYSHRPASPSIESPTSTRRRLGLGDTPVSSQKAAEGRAYFQAQGEVVLRGGSGNGNAIADSGRRERIVER